MSAEATQHENAKQKGSSHPGGDDPMDIGAFGKGKGKQGKGKHGKGKDKGSKDSKDSTDRTRTRARIRLNVGTVESADHYYSARNKFERFRGFLGLISRFEFEFCRCVNYFFLKDSIFWCVHVNVPWPVCAHAIPFRMLWLL